MLLKSKRLITATAVAGALSVGAAAPAFAQVGPGGGPVVTGGLVNVTVANVLNNNTVQVAVPIDVAAAICGVNVTALAQQFNQQGSATCTAQNGGFAGQTVNITHL